MKTIFPSNRRKSRYQKAGRSKSVGLSGGRRNRRARIAWSFDTRLARTARQSDKAGCRWRGAGGAARGTGPRGAAADRLPPGHLRGAAGGPVGGAVRRRPPPPEARALCARGRHLAADPGAGGSRPRAGGVDRTVHARVATA